MTLSPEIKRRLDAWWDDAGEMARLTPRVKKNDFAARESVYALHVRSLDGADISRPSLVSVCR
jgi:hypothetical protein